MDENINEFDSAASLGAALSIPQRVADLSNYQPFVTIPDGYTIHNLEDTMPSPTRKHGTASLQDAESFVAYFKKHAEANAEVYGTRDPAKFTAVFNGHTLDTAGWGDHRATYSCPFTVEWKTWSSKSGRKMTQLEFAQFIEDNLPDVVEPVGADMLEISRSLEAKKKVNFASGVRLNNGANELLYEETIAGTAAKGKLQIPEIFVLGIHVFEGGDPYRVEARLRYQIAECKLVIWFDIVRPHKVIEAALKDVWQRLENETGAKILNGTPL